MKIIDCFMYYDEDLVLDIRFNILNEYVSYFLICEANYNHNGTKRDLKFNINNFPKFKEKIIYIGIRTNNFKYIKKFKSHPKDPKKNINEIFIDLKNDKLEKINLINDSTYLETINLFREIYEKRIKDLGLN